MLLLPVYDATGRVVSALFCEYENTRDYFVLMRDLIEGHGLPIALYTDRHSIFKHVPGTGVSSAPTQFSRAMDELGIEMIYALSPQAKGRVERAAGTFQDRLVTELRFAGATTISSISTRREQKAEEERLRILAVDDDPNDLRYVRDTLAKSGYDPVVTGDPQEALRLVADERPELVLLDLMLPGTDGIELMKDILDVADVPVIFLSAYGREELVARAFDTGAADYVVKPFSPTELAARIRASLRKRAVPEPSEPYVLGDLTIDYAQRRVTLAGQPVHLTPTEYRVLAEISANEGRLVTYERLLDRVWKKRESDGDVRPIRTIVRRLRRKLGDDADNPTYIFTEPRVGYRMPEGEGPSEA